MCTEQIDTPSLLPYRLVLACTVQILPSLYSASHPGLPPRPPPRGLDTRLSLYAPHQYIWYWHTRALKLVHTTASSDLMLFYSRFAPESHQKFLPPFGWETLQLRATSCKLCPAPPPLSLLHGSAHEAKMPANTPVVICLLLSFLSLSASKSERD